jgi:DNA-binding GntR family transcriptional regulator
MTKKSAKTANALFSLQRGPLRDKIYSAISMQIVRGALPPGRRLRDFELAEDLGVSRTPVREALVRLTTDGLVTADAGRGFTVRGLSVVHVQETYPIVWTLEGLALRICPTPDARRMQALRTQNSKLSAANLSPFERLVIDEAWHQLLLSQCGNVSLLAMLERVKRPLQVYECAYNALKPVQTSVVEHEAILDALAAGNTDGAVLALERNWRGTCEHLVQWLSASPQAPTGASVDPEMP